MGLKGSNPTIKFGVSIVLVLCIAALVVFKTELFEAASPASGGLSGMVTVKGTVNVNDLELTSGEVARINQVLGENTSLFTQVNLFLDAKKNVNLANGSTILVMAMVLETDGDCEVRSWSRKVSRAELVQQFVVYMGKAAKEYEQFQKYPDVKQNFKCLYI